MSNKALAIITARGGSKRIPRKNIKNFHGYPIIKYSIDAAKQAKCFNEIMVSTDSQEIAEIAKTYDVSIPFLRSKKNSGDFASTVDVINEVIMDYNKINRKFDFVCCIYPTAPFISADKLRQGYELLISKQADSVIPVVRFNAPIQRALKIEGDYLKMVLPENLNKRSQDLMPYYHDVGQYYWLNCESFLKKNTILSDKTVPIELSSIEVQDIDNEVDWKLAEMKYLMLHKEL